MSPRWTLRLLRHTGVAVWALIGIWIIGIGGGIAGAWRPRGLLVGVLVPVLCLLVVVVLWTRWQREHAVREAALPQFLKRKLRDTYPQLTGRDCDLVERGLRQFFLACLRSNRRFVAMPSRVVDAMWHEFILHTRGYRDWCELALGRFLHHTPAEALGAHASTNDGLRRAWYWACRDESIDPRAPSRLPLLFALDGKLRIEGGFHYLPDCRDGVRRLAEGGAAGGAIYCGTSFSSADFSGDGATMGGVDGSAGGDGGGDDGGSGCGGD